MLHYSWYVKKKKKKEKKKESVKANKIDWEDPFCSVRYVHACGIQKLIKLGIRGRFLKKLTSV